MRRVPAAAVFLIFSVPLCGCMENSLVVFHEVRCDTVEAGDRVEAVVFTSTFETNDLEGRQLVYQVRLYGSDRRALISKDGLYETRDGIVGATKALMVHLPNQRFERVSVRIPASQLSLQAKHLPPLAEIGLFDLKGHCLARKIARVPISDMKQIQPPMAPAPPAEESSWFIKRDDVYVAMDGPFNTMSDAIEAHPNAPEPPRKYSADDYVWFVPVFRTNGTGSVRYYGPYCCEEDAVEVFCRLAGVDGAEPHTVGRMCGGLLTLGQPLQVGLVEGLSGQINVDPVDLCRLMLAGDRSR